MKGLVIIPTYNEKENISRLIAEIFSQNLSLDILVVDDNSPDGTGQSVEDLQKGEPRLFLLSREKKDGLGRAYIAGFAWAIKNNYDFVIQMDADFSHQPKYLKLFCEEIANFDLVIGSRYVLGGQTEGWPFYRKFLSRFASLYAKTILGVKINDLTGGFNCLRLALLEKIDYSQITSRGYSFLIELKYKAAKNGARIKEIPITFVDRALGQSKISKAIIFEAAINCWLLRFKRWTKGWL